MKKIIYVLLVFFSICFVFDLKEIDALEDGNLSVVTISETHTNIMKGVDYILVDKDGNPKDNGEYYKLILYNTGIDEYFDIVFPMDFPLYDVSMREFDFANDYYSRYIE